MLEGKRIFISGGSRGLGRTFTRVFLQYGAKVAFNYSSNEEEANNTLNDLRSKNYDVLTFKGSVIDENAIDKMCTEIESLWGGIDVLVNNAGVSQPLPFPLLDIEDWDYVMDTNVKGQFLLVRSFLRYMIRERRGVILNIGSLAGERILESPLHYSTSKAAISGFTRSLAKEFGRYNIRVNCLAPGLIDEGLGKSLPKHKVNDYINHTAFGRLVSCEEVAELAVFLVSSKNSFMTGHTIIMDGGI